MKLFKSARKYGAAALASTVGLAGSAMAAVPAEVTTAIADTKTDILSIGGSMFVLTLAVVGFIYMRRTAK